MWILHYKLESDKKQNIWKTKQLKKKVGRVLSASGQNLMHVPVRSPCFAGRSLQSNGLWGFPREYFWWHSLESRQTVTSNACKTINKSKRVQVDQKKDFEKRLKPSKFLLKLFIGLLMPTNNYLGQCINHGQTHAMQTTWDFIATTSTTKFSTSMQNLHH